jgi:hypothetical protein
MVVELYIKLSSDRMRDRQNVAGKALGDLSRMIELGII